MQSEKKTRLHRKIELSHDTPKPFPFADRAEKFVLGALLVDSGAIVRIASKLQPKHFYKDRQGNIYTAILDLFKRSEGIDILTVFERCIKLFPKQKFTPYEISELSQVIYTSKHIEDHAQLIIDKYTQRQLMRFGNKMLYLASAPAGDIPEMIGSFGGEFMEIAREAMPSKQISKEKIISSILDKAMNPTGKIAGIPTGIKELDTVTEGLEKGDLIIIGGRPAMGKTALLTTIAQNVAFEQNTPIAFFSYEMTKKRIYQRIISSRAGVNSRKIGKEKLTKDELQALEYYSDDVYNSNNFHFENGRGLDAVGIRAKSMVLKQQHNIQAIFIDYLQRIPILKGYDRKSTHDAIGGTTKALAELALELDIPIIVPCQLNREGTKGGGRPTLAALRDSGNIEDDAVKVWFIHRPEYYGIEELENGESTKGVAEIITAKSRNGELGITICGFDAPTTKFYSLNNHSVFCVEDDNIEVKSQETEPDDPQGDFIANDDEYDYTQPTPF